MNRLKAIFFLTALISSAALARSPWHVKGSDAMVSMDMVNARKPNTVATFLVPFNPQRGCSPEVALILTEAGNLGERRQQQLLSDDRMVVSVGGRAYSDATALRQYANGYETVMSATNDLLGVLGSNSVAQVKMMREAPWVEFNISGAGEALRQARGACR
jgi:hypothetical protein